MKQGTVNTWESIWDNFVKAVRIFIFGVFLWTLAFMVGFGFCIHTGYQINVENRDKEIAKKDAIIKKYEEQFDGMNVDNFSKAVIMTDRFVREISKLTGKIYTAEYPPEELTPEPTATPTKKSGKGK